MPKKDQLQGKFYHKKDTRGGKKHFANMEDSPFAGALYLSKQQMQDLGATDMHNLEVIVRVRK
jgi:hypothetical protein